MGRHTAAIIPPCKPFLTAYLFLLNLILRRGGAHTRPGTSRVFLRTLEGSIDTLLLGTGRPWLQVETQTPLVVQFDPEKNWLFSLEPLDDGILLTGSTQGAVVLFSETTGAQHMIAHG